MRRVTQTRAIRHDVRRMQKRGKDLTKLFDLIEQLSRGEPLNPKHRPHPLVGNWKPKWNCHIEPDWLLIYEVNEAEVLLARTDSHAVLFK